MTAPISVRLDAEVRATLETEAKSQGIGLGTLLRHLAADAARDVRRRQIRTASAAVAQHIATSPEAKSFNDSWIAPDWHGL